MDGAKAEGGYWEKRRLALLKQMERDEAKLNAKLAKVYEAEIAKLGREIASYYQRYGEENVIEYRKLLVALSDEDRKLLIERMEEFGRKYPQHAHLLPVRESIYRLNEMEGIQLSMRMQQLEIGAIEQEDLQRHLEKQALRSANLAAEQMGFGTAFYTADASVIKATVGAAWAGGKSFSERIWGNREKLAAYLNDDFAKAVARGESYDRIMREMGKRFENVSKRDMTRLVFTEGTFVFNEAHAQVHEQTFERYTLSTASDKGVCSQCLGVEAQTKKEPVLFKDRLTGVNFPPLHPGCRCSYEVAVEDWDAWIEQQVAEKEGHDVSGGYGSNSKWLEQFESEVATVTIDGEEVYRKVGGPDWSTFPLALPNGHSYERADLHHTHTTPIGGTFSDVDIVTTVSTRCASHTVTHTLTGREYKLVRTSKATKDSMERMKNDFVGYYWSTRGDAEYAYWEKHNAAAEVPNSDAENREVLKSLQPTFDKWLKENAEKYGYVYSS